MDIVHDGNRGMDDPGHHSRRNNWHLHSYKLVRRMLPNHYRADDKKLIATIP